MIQLLREVRLQKGFSQRDLALKANIAYKTIQLIEAGEHDIRLSTLEKIATALDLPLRQFDEALLQFLGYPFSILTLSEQITQEGFHSWKSHLFEWVDDFRKHPNMKLIIDAPSKNSISRTRCLLASVVETLCEEVPLTAPWWCSAVEPLEEPWFPSNSENLKALALREAAIHFRKRNIFVLHNFLSRV
jgi:transcriptional regulator with XRE-family HTH domain